MSKVFISRLAIGAAPEAATTGNAEEAGAKAQRRKARPASKVFEQREKCLRKAGNRQKRRESELFSKRKNVLKSIK